MIRMKTDKKLSAAAREWIAKNVDCYDTDYNRINRKHFMLSNEGKIYYDTDKVKPNRDPSYDVGEIMIGELILKNARIFPI